MTRHVPEELARDDWNAMIMHYLGLDHIGHKTGPQGPNMLPKQREMDGIVKQIYEAMESERHHEKTLLVLAGDHGMNAGGNHGGSGPGETEPALLFASPRFKKMDRALQYECPTAPKEGTEFHYYTKLEQSDIVPALAGLMGMPISKNSLGMFIPELEYLLPKTQSLQVLQQNARQMLHIINAKYGAEAFLQEVHTRYSMIVNEDTFVSTASEEQELAAKWATVWHAETTNQDSSKITDAIYDFLHHTQEAMSDTASSYDIPRMITGMAIAGISLILLSISFPSLWPPSWTGVFFAIMSLLYGVMMFASSYVEEEQHFWYWLTPSWVVLLAARGLLKSTDGTHKLKIAASAFLLLSTHRLAVRWNQTGQKHAGEPDIVRTVFPEHFIFMWILILTTYVLNGVFIHKRTLAGIVMPELSALINTTLMVLGIVFKLNFTQADAPELVQGLAWRIREYSRPFSLVFQARAVFGVLAATAITVVVLSVRKERVQPNKQGEAEARISLPERLHYLLALFLMTQTRASNIPLFIAFEVQRISLSWLLTGDNPASPTSYPSAAQVAISSLLLSNVYYFCMGGSNSISSIDLSNAYNGVDDYNIAAVGVLLFASNWAGPIWWCSGAVLLTLDRPSDQSKKSQKQSEIDREWVMVEREKLNEDAIASTSSKDQTIIGSGSAPNDSWLLYISTMTAFMSASLLAVMAACTALRTHLFIWTVFSPKYLYAMAWSIGWHLMINIGFGSLLYSIRRIA